MAKRMIPSRSEAASPSLQTGLIHQRQNSLALIVVMLEEQVTTRGQRQTSPVNDATNGLQPIVPTGERQMGLMITNHRRQPGHLIRGDVGRITEYEVELTPPGAQGPPPTAAVELTAMRRQATPQIAFRKRERGRAEIDTMACRFRPFAGQHDGEGAGNSAQVSPTTNRHRSDSPLCQIHQQFGFLAGIKAAEDTPAPHHARGSDPPNAEAEQPFQDVDASAQQGVPASTEVEQCALDQSEAVATVTRTRPRQSPAANRGRQADLPVEAADGATA